ARCAGVRESVVVARQDASGNTALAAYFVAMAGSGADGETLRAELAAQLPDHMLPTAWVNLAALPLNTSGKVDRSQLPPVALAASASRSYEPPADDTEVALAAIWRALLALDQVGRNDHFFEVGGHSLLAVQLFSRVRRALGVQLRWTELFANPTLAQLAALVRGKEQDTLEAIAAATPDAARQLSFAEERLWFIDQLDGPSDRYHMPLVLAFQGQLDVPALEHGLRQLFARHDALRSCFVARDGVPVREQLAADAAPPLELLDLRGMAAPLREAERRRHIAACIAQPFRLDCGPLIRHQLLRLADDHHVLVMVQHHIVSDGRSQQLLLRELGRLYRAAAHGQATPPAPSGPTYADYAAWQRRSADSARLARQRTFWRQLLQGAPGVIDLPYDRPRAPVAALAADTVTMTLDAPLCAALAALGQRYGCTLFMTLLGAWGALLVRLSGQREVMVGVPVAGRTRMELEDIVGLFVNTLPLRIALPPESTVAHLLEAVRQQVLAAQDSQELPLEQIVELAAPPRSRAYTPLFQVMFNLETDHGDDGPLLEGLQCALLPASLGHAKTELSLGMAWRAGRIEASLSYATALLDRSSAQRWLGYLSAMLGAMANDADVPIEQISLLDEAERRRLLLEA
ncbi:condensation domain-containing protein, partial [Rugamonas sp. A1-17]|nr:condensation domain-containing protein [Rugamonas sp. A1-17]